MNVNRKGVPLWHRILTVVAKNRSLYSALEIERRKSLYENIFPALMNFEL